MLKLKFVFLALSALNFSVSAAPLRGSQRELQQNEDKNNKNKNKDSGSSSSSVFTFSDNEDEVAGPGGIVERHACVSDWQREKDRMPDPAIVEYAQDGSTECYEDPVNGCPGGCCRTSMTYFLCDSSGDQIRSLPCICNDLTAEVVIATPPPTNPPVFVSPMEAPVGIPITSGVALDNSFVSALNATEAPTTGLDETLSMEGDIPAEPEMFGSP